MQQVIRMSNTSSISTSKRRSDHPGHAAHDGVQNGLRIKALVYQRRERRRSSERVGFDHSEVRHGVDIGTAINDLEPKIDKFSTLRPNPRPIPTTGNRVRQCERLPLVLRAEGCQSGRMGRSRKPLRRSASPWVQIPPLPLRAVAEAQFQTCCLRFCSTPPLAVSVARMVILDEYDKPSRRKGTNRDSEGDPRSRIASFR